MSETTPSGESRGSRSGIVNRLKEILLGSGSEVKKGSRVESREEIAVRLPGRLCSSFSSGRLPDSWKHALDKPRSDGELSPKIHLARLLRGLNGEDPDFPVICQPKEMRSDKPLFSGYHSKMISPDDTEVGDLLVLFVNIDHPIISRAAKSHRLAVKEAEMLPILAELAESSAKLFNLAEGLAKKETKLMSVQEFARLMETWHASH